VPQMLYEHDEGRKYVKLMEEGINKDSPAMVVEGAQKYIMMIREHIYKEDSIMYPLAEDYIEKEVEKNMLKNFKIIEKNNKKNENRHLAFVKSLK